MNQCSKCGQELPLDQEVFQNFDRMCKIWISLLMQPTKELISIEQFDRLFNPKMEKKW